MGWHDSYISCNSAVSKRLTHQFSNSIGWDCNCMTHGNPTRGPSLWRARHPAGPFLRAPGGTSCPLRTTESLQSQDSARGRLVLLVHPSSSHGSHWASSRTGTCIFGKGHSLPSVKSEHETQEVTEHHLEVSKRTTGLLFLDMRIMSLIALTKLFSNISGNSMLHHYRKLPARTHLVQWLYRYSQGERLKTEQAMPTLLEGRGSFGLPLSPSAKKKLVLWPNFSTREAFTSLDQNLFPKLKSCRQFFPAREMG